jgi:hypothetical protein
MPFAVLVKFIIFILNTPKHCVMTHKRNCPNCNCELDYINKRSWYNANRLNSKCKTCYNKSISVTLKQKYKNNQINFVPRNKEREKTLIKKFKRNCPNCDIELKYATIESLNTAKRKNTICNSCSAYKYNKTFKDVIKPQHTLQMRATKAGFQNFDEYKEKYPKKQFYKREVWRLTYQKPIDTLENWKFRGRCGVEGAYQLDHIRSIDWGWKNAIDAEVIADWDNLRMIPWKTNLLKSSK